ncbi:cardiolipin synthase [Rhodococcus sp. BP-332]|uniref:DISARM system phospholipase D-like protein DrmC n=1 Tax=Rhodococcus sp. BP-332 TaxID=2739447 RepID=UPI001C9A4D3B|nr:DISARM system phospholipase D-like protein DrmC [Rhodococcus sp. BP-332]MBY6676544.1 cardiolipin synthase [Rhodococcus sp. BP-332]
MPSDPFVALGQYLTASEAEALAAQFDNGQHSIKALGTINPGRRADVKQLLAAAGLGHADNARATEVLLGIAGAKSVHRDMTPVWTMPGNEAKLGRLTGEFHRLVQAARISVTCATYNFEITSKMWTVLEQASERPGVVVTVYVDGGKADANKVKAQLPRATIYRSADMPFGKRVVSHAKFVVIDHELMLLTSANFSFSAENLNIELGVLIRDTALAESIEETMKSKHGSLYELVLGQGI